MRIRSADDGYGELNIPIDWALNYAKVSTAVAEQSHRAYCCSLRIKQDEEIAARHEALRVNTATVVSTDTRIRLAVASKHRVVLLPKQPMVVLCAGSRAGEIARGVDMVWAAEDDEDGEYCLHEGVALMAIDDADMGVMLSTDDEGETKLRVCNTGTTPIELEFGVELFQLRPAPKDAYEIAHIPDEVRALLSDEHREILLAMTQASDMSSGTYCARTYRPPNGDVSTPVGRASIADPAQGVMTNVRRSAGGADLTVEGAGASKQVHFDKHGETGIEDDELGQSQRDRASPTAAPTEQLKTNEKWSKHVGEWSKNVLKTVRETEERQRFRAAQDVCSADGATARTRLTMAENLPIKRDATLHDLLHKRYNVETIAEEVFE